MGRGAQKTLRTTGIHSWDSAVMMMHSCQNQGTPEHPSESPRSLQQGSSNPTLEGLMQGV